MSPGLALAADPLVVTCTLSPRYEAVRAARDFARASLGRWGMEALYDDVALVASELVTNALRHALRLSGEDGEAAVPHPRDPFGGTDRGPAERGPSDHRPTGRQDAYGGQGFGAQGLHGADGRTAGAAGAAVQPIRISLVHRTPQIVCAVSDPSSSGPVTRDADFGAESGRGLHLVECFTRSWGWHPLAGAGKVVWAMFDAPAAQQPGPGRHRRA